MKTMLFVFASLIVTTSAFAQVGPKDSAKCREIAAAVKNAKAAAPAAGQGTQQPAVAPAGGARVVN